MTARMPYEKGQPFDAGLRNVISWIRDHIIGSQDDDWLMLCVGGVGTGKSRLMLSSYEYFDPEGASLDYVGINREDHAKALQKASVKQFRRFCGYDELNISRRNVNEEYQRDLLQTFNEIRGKNIFHWWNNPTMQLIDRIFIQERIRGLIFIFTKDQHRPRQYYYFRRTELLKVYDDFKGNLSQNVLKKAGKMGYAWFRGWFRNYEGGLLEEYLARKTQKMDDTIETFAEKWGLGVKYKYAEAARKLGVSAETVKNKIMKFAGDGSLVDGRHYVRDAMGRYRVTQEGLNELFSILMEDDTRV